MLALNTSFNPYFSGCFSLSEEVADILFQEYNKLFQSLFFWMLLSKSPGMYSPAVGLNFVFQSLFFWMLLSKHGLTAARRSGLSGFNPYFSGCFSLRLARAVFGLFIIQLFQSLFFWMLLSKGCLRLPLQAWCLQVVSILIFLDASL